MQQTQTDWITRQDAIALSGLSSGQLSRLDAAGTIVPRKFGGSSHPVVLYSQPQILELQLVAKLKGKASHSELKVVLEGFRRVARTSKDLKGFVVLFDGNACFTGSRSALLSQISLSTCDGKVAEFKVIAL